MNLGIEAPELTGNEAEDLESLYVWATELTDRLDRIIHSLSSYISEQNGDEM